MGGDGDAKIDPSVNSFDVYEGTKHHGLVEREDSPRGLPSVGGLPPASSPPKTTLPRRGPKCMTFILCGTCKPYGSRVPAFFVDDGIRPSSPSDPSPLANIRFDPCPVCSSPPANICNGPVDAWRGRLVSRVHPSASTKTSCDWW